VTVETFFFDDGLSLAGSIYSVYHFSKLQPFTVSRIAQGGLSHGVSSDATQAGPWHKGDMISVFFNRSSFRVAVFFI
jgi:hypothetical protein